MRIDDRFNAITHDPVQRLIRAHREGLADAMRPRQTSDTAPAAREADAGQCRLVVNALRRQIGRLERTLAAEMIDRLTTGPDDVRHSDTLSDPPDPTTGRPQCGMRQIEFVRYVVPPADPRLPALVFLPLLTSNTGGLIDLLA